MARGKTPSRERYDRTHPVVAIRVTQELKNEMEALRASGRSWGDILRVGLGRQTAADKSLQQARQEGHRQGYEEARARYAITFPCSICGKPVEVTGEEGKQLAARPFVTGHWTHGACNRTRR